MPQLVEHQNAVLAAERRLRDAERQAEQLVDEARESFRAALTDAHRAGVSYAMLGRLLGLSRQRVARIVAD
ncbi:hypothetical protein [Gaiella sp.]|uniref:hypothetical protein n=1 Tax=Gaiella sp. TaxID=2663207 RepID=UPI002E3095E0|nr:hypothetical protein [Gaiella sp.]HEX5583733.1 hypothetical protein [Gaiella sp.]